MFALYPKSRILRRIVFLSFVIGFTISMGMSLLQAYRSYTLGQKEVLSQLDFLVEAVLPPLQNHLWNVDEASIVQTMKAISRDPNVARVEIKESHFEVPTIQTHQKPDWIVKEYPVTMQQNGRSHDLGILSVHLARGNFIQRFQQELITAVLKYILTFAFTAFVLIAIFNHKVTRPVHLIQQMTHRFSVEQLSSILGHVPTRKGHPDITEIEALLMDVHQLQTNFQTALKMQRDSEAKNLQTQIELEKERQKMKMTQRLDSIGQITAQVVHDFGNVVMVVNGKLFTLERMIQDENKLKLLKDVRKAVLRAQGLTTKMLRITRQQAAKPLIFDPFQNLEELSDLLKTAVGSSISLNIETDGSAGCVEAQQVNFENAVLNLCVNARDAMPNGGQISILIESEKQDGKSYVRVSVKDTGMGIPLELQEKIFEPFFTTKDSGKGSGLGLAQVQDFVKETGGFLDLVSGPTGACFRLHLPEKISRAELPAA